MPSFNSETFISKSIESVVNQTYKNWELIIIDDKSQDQTCKIIEEYLTKDERIKLIKLDANGGPANARNIGIDQSNERFIAFIDSDDIWVPDKLSKQLSVFLKEKCAICFSSFIKVHENNNSNEVAVFSRRMLTYENMLKLNYIGCSTAVYDTNICGKMHMPLIRYAEDYSLWLSILKKNNNTAIGIEEPLVKYYVRSNSESQGKLRAAAGHWKALYLYGEVSLLKKIMLFCYYAVWHCFMIFINKLK